MFEICLQVVVVGRAQSATYTAVKTGHQTSLSPLIFVYSRPGLEKSLSLYGHLKGVTCLALNRTVIVSGSVDMSVRLWCRERGDQLHVIMMQVRTTSDNQFSPSLSGHRDLRLSPRGQDHLLRSGQDRPDSPHHIPRHSPGL